MRVALAVAPAAEERLVEEASRHGNEVVARCGSADELASMLASIRPDVAIVASAERYLNTRLLAEADRTSVQLLALIDSDAGRRYAADVGLHETARFDAEWSEIEEELRREPLSVDPIPGPRDGRGAVIAVWGPVGSPGRTTLSINIAAELASAGHTVALADVDTYSGSIAPALGLLDEAPGFAAACRLASTRSLNRTELERIAQRYTSAHGSFWVLTGIARASRWPELSAERVRASLEECRSWVDYTVVDTGFNLESDDEITSDVFAPRRNAATITALQHADHVVAVGAADPVGLSRFLRSHVDLVETVMTDQITVAMNRVRSSAIGPTPHIQLIQSLERFGGITEPVLIPHDQLAHDAAILNGATLYDVAPKSPARQAIGAFVSDRILPPAFEESARSRQRWFRPRSRAV